MGTSQLIYLLFSQCDVSSNDGLWWELTVHEIKMYKLLKYDFIMFSDYTNDKANVAGPGVYTAMLLLSMAFVLKLVTTIFTFGIKV